MSAVLLDGRELAKTLREKYKAEAVEAAQAAGRPIVLRTIRIGDAEDARLYEDAIGRLMERVGIRHDRSYLKADVTLPEIYKTLTASVEDPQITGILILSPVPPTIPYADLLAALPIRKDAEGTRYNEGEGGVLGVFPPTALACFELVQSARLPIAGRRAVVLGRSRIVGRPVSELLLRADATVTICHSKTTDLAACVSAADIVIAAAGKAGLIKGAWIKPGAVVVDAGENVVNGSPVGDVEFASAKERAGFITPVPGGVGPVTSLMLVKNLIALARFAARRTTGT